MDGMLYLKVFLVGGLLCALGQLGLSLTRLTTARILVIYVTAGVVLGGLGLYEPLVNWAGAGATGLHRGRHRHRRRRGRGHPLWVSVRFAGSSEDEDVISPAGRTRLGSCP